MPKYKHMYTKIQYMNQISILYRNKPQDAIWHEWKLLHFIGTNYQERVIKDYIFELKLQIKETAP